MRIGISTRRWGILCIAFSALSSSGQNTLDSWTWRNPLPTGNLIRKVDRVNGQFVCLTFGHELVTSADGVHWTPVTLSIAGTPFCVAYGNGRYVLVGGQNDSFRIGEVGDTGLIASSSDLVNWTVHASGTTNQILAVTFGGGKFVAVGVGGYVATSTDGMHWNIQNGNPAVNWRCITYGNGRFVMADINSPANVWTSTDGVTWNSTAVNPSGMYVAALSFVGNRFYASGGAYHGSNMQPQISISTDGMNWSAAAVPGDASAQAGAVAGANGLFVCTGDNGGIPLLVSTDGTNFSGINPASYMLSGIPTLAGGQGLFVNVQLQTSTDATNWLPSLIQPTNSPQVTDLLPLKTGFSTLSSPVMTSLDGLVFSVTTNTLPGTANRAKFSGGVYIAVGQNGLLLRSTNGVAWEQRNAATSQYLSDIDCSPSLWVAVGAGGAVTTSTTGNAWTLRGSGTTYTLRGIVYAAGQFVVVGDFGTVLTSPDGINWTAQWSGSLSALYQITYDDALYVAVGANGLILTSPDGVDWTPQNSGTTAALYSVASGDGAFCAVGTLLGSISCVLTSRDAIHWTQRIVPVSGALGMAVRYFNGSFFVMNHGNILQSGEAAPIQLQLSAIQPHPAFTIFAKPNLVLRVQSTDVPGTDSWIDRQQITNSPSGNSSFTDLTADLLSQRFYRVVSP